MTDEQIIKRKLLFDGDGTGDDRRINLLQKMIVKWILTKYDTEEEIKAMHDKIWWQLSAVEHSRRKSELIKMGCDKQLNSYKAYLKEMGNNIANVKEAIEASKVLLAEVKYAKHHKVGYDLIAKDIKAETSREKTTRTVEELTKQLSQLDELKIKLNNEWSNHRRQFRVIATSAKQLQVILENNSLNLM
ncbi:hypothetical protein JTB14_029674 [Gonioctena quinquepunctata]|nr:hypothetical protein JTB14_029674 [Gonioctena quinquepunctata]